MARYRIIRPDDSTLLKVVEGPDDAIAAVLSYATCSEAPDRYLEARLAGREVMDAIRE